MVSTTRLAVLVLVIGLSCTNLSADAAKDAWKHCSRATDKETRLQECSLAIDAGSLPKDIVADALLLRASAYAELGDHDRAIADLDQSVILNPSAFRSFNTRGWEYLRKFDYQRAMQDFNLSIQLNPKNDYAYNNRGIAHFLLGDFVAAESDFATALSLSPKNVRGFSALNRMLARMRQAKEGAKPDLSAVKFDGDLKEWPGPILSYYLGASSLEVVVQNANSRPEREKQWKLCQAYFFFAERALIEGKRDEALGLLQKSIDTDAANDVEYAWAQGELRNLRNVQTGNIP